MAAYRVDLDLTESERRALEALDARGLGTPSRIATAAVRERLGRLPLVHALPRWPGDLVLSVQERRHLPSDLWVLYVVERDLVDAEEFYTAKGRLFHAIRDAVVQADLEPPDGEAFLSWLRSQSQWVWAIPALEAPPRRRGRPGKDDAPDLRTLRIARLLWDRDPEYVLVIGPRLEPTVRHAARLAQFREPDIVVLPSPARPWRGRFIADLARFLTPSDKAVRDAMRGTAAMERQAPALHIAMAAVLEAEGRRLLARELANEIAARGLYRRADGASSPASQVRSRAHQYPQVFQVSEAGIGLADWEPESIGQEVDP